MRNTLVLLKPDCVDRHLSGNIISRLENKGFRIVGMKMLKMTREMAAQHYYSLRERPFFKDLLDYITSGPIVALVVRGADAITIVRRMIGNTDGAEAEPGSIRGDFSMCVRFNVVHSSDSEESAKREIEFFFDESEIFERRDPFWQRKWS